MSKMVSVIIPTFNRGWCILEAVKSVVAQDYSSTIEIVVVDDGSTDNTEELLKIFVNKHITSTLSDSTEQDKFIDQNRVTNSGEKFTYHGQILFRLLRQENRGVSSARNLGIKNSRGDFIAFLDSDDLWLPDKLSCQIDFFRENPDAMICQTEEIWMRKGKRVNPRVKHKKLSGMIFEPSLHLCLVSPSAVMMRRQFFDIKGLFDETLVACEDYDLWLRTATDMPIWLVDKVCIIKNGGHYDQLSSNHSLDKYRIRSIVNLLNGDANRFNIDIANHTIATHLNSSQRDAAIKVLCEKCEIYSQGCIKRGKIDEAKYYSETGKFWTAASSRPL